MCGICGYISKRRITKEELSVMNDTLTHRGPNDAGVELYPEQDGYVVGFAQRRLSILDLSPSGHQPMHSQG
ncbi:MAG: asparagine synthetase B, partial [Lachnospiraceae bacterium]|nr:asparagine synthetase B [Lachnospiraceae bacterium]